MTDFGERASVVGVVRSAVNVSDFQVIITARTNTDKHEPS